MTIQTPPTAWDPAGPETPYADVKVAGTPLTDPDGEPLDLVVRDRRGGGKAKLLLVGGALVTLVAVGAAVLTIVNLGDDAEGTAQAAATVAPGEEQVEPEPTPLSAEQEKKALKDRAIAAAADDDVPALKTKTAPTPEPTEPADVGAGAGPAVSPGTAQAIAKKMLKGYGWDPDTQFGCLYNLWNKESGWRTTAGSVNGPYGIPQANPGTKMASAGPKWQTDAATQIKWGLGYVKGRYSTPCGAWSHFLANHWY